MEHLFLMCPYASAVWCSVKDGVHLTLAKKSLSSMKRWVFEFLGRSSPIQATTLAVTFWHIWEARNDTRNGKGHLAPVRLAAKIKGYVDNIVEVCYDRALHRRGEPEMRSRWTPPPRDSVCVNVDAAVFSADQRMGMGMVIRDHYGVVKLIGNEGISGTYEPEMGEAFAIRRALVIARDNGFTKIILASDCLSMIQRIRALVRDRSCVGAVVSDIKTLATDFSTISFQHYNRSNNVVAHLLARRSEPGICNISLAEVPDYVRDELCNDVV